MQTYYMNKDISWQTFKGLPGWRPKSYGKSEKRGTQLGPSRVKKQGHSGRERGRVFRYVAAAFMTN